MGYAAAREHPTLLRTVSVSGSKAAAARIPVCHSSAEICFQSNTVHHHRRRQTVDMLTCPINQVSHNSVNPPQFQVVEERLEDIGALAERRRQRGRDRSWSGA